MACQGISDFEPMRANARQRLAELRTGDGRPIPERMKAEIGRELDRLALLRSQIAEVEAERNALLSAGTKAEAWQPEAEERETDSPGAQLMKLRGIGPEVCDGALARRPLIADSPIGASWQPTLGWRPAHGKSGDVNREQGISKSGNARLRDHDDRSCLAMAPTPAGIGTEQVVP